MNYLALQSVEAFEQLANKEFDASKALLARLLEEDFEDLAFLETYNELSVLVDNIASRSSLLLNVHPEEVFRTSAEQWQQDVDAFATKLSLNRELYDRFVSINVDNLDEEATRLVEKTLAEYRRSGVDKDEQTRNRIATLSEELTELGQTFSRNIREDVRSITLESVDQLEGLPEDYITTHAPNEGAQITITTDYPDYYPFMRYAKDDTARKELSQVFKNRAFPQNQEVLGGILQKRFELAQLLGYAHWADVVTEDKMIGSAKNVSTFLDQLDNVTAERAQRDLTTLLEIKQQFQADATVVHDWEAAYYEEILKKQQYAFDSQSVRPYFSYNKVHEGLLELTSELFGITYKKISDTPTWHDAVHVYDVLEGEQPIGRIYLDMHPRENKFKHAAQFTISSGVDERQLPIGALVCNFPDPKDGAALMGHGEVTTFFHEFGHLLHHILGGQNQRWIRFSGVVTEWDFVETPSQLFEEWAWNATILQRFAHHNETGEPISEALVNKMKKANQVGRGLFVRQQLFYSSLSLEYHAIPPQTLDTLHTLRELQDRYSPYPYVEDTYFHMSFGHLYGYSAIYYTYMWSLVIAKDMFSAFSAHGLLDKKTAMRYRQCVLNQGGKQDAADMIHTFLGREYSFDTFANWLKE